MLKLNLRWEHMSVDAVTFVHSCQSSAFISVTFIQVYFYKFTFTSTQVLFNRFTLSSTQVQNKSTSVIHEYHI